jgi:hypothetical protein
MRETSLVGFSAEFVVSEVLRGSASVAGVVITKLEPYFAGTVDRRAP